MQSKNETMKNIINNRLFLLWSVSIMMVFSLIQCSPIQGLQKSYSSSYTAGNYAESLSAAEALLALQGKDGKEVPIETYLMAGKSAFQLKDSDKAMKYLGMAYSLGSYDNEMLSNLADLYKSEDNLSKEMRVLNDLMKSSDSEYAKSKLERYFLINIEAELYEKADSLWSKQSDSFRQSLEGLQGYLTLNNKLGKDKVAIATAKKVIKLSPNDYDAKRTLALDAYNRAEDHYKRSMATYNRNKTRKNYATLLKQLKQSGKNYRYALGKLKSVYKVKKEKKIALYISNVYARLNNKNSAAYYRRLAK